MDLRNISIAKSPALISLYVHIPFCRKKCRYCHFYSVSDNDPVLQRRVIDGIIDELKFFLDRLSGVRFKTVYIGGGTPSMLERPVLEQLLSSIRGAALDLPEEWTIEANPDSIDTAFLRLCHEYGVSRISVGVQTFSDPLLRILGRVCENKDIVKAAELLRTGWNHLVNIDLLCGIPGQTRRLLKEDIEMCVNLFSPHHISFYSLTVEEQTILKRLVDENKIRLPEIKTQDGLWFYGYRLLEDRGLSNYEISNFSLPGRECRHNMGYWLLEPYIGIGPSAVSTLYDPKGGVLRISHAHDIALFLPGKASDWGMAHEKISANDHLFERCLMGFRLKDGFPEDGILCRYKKSLPDLVPELWYRWKARRYVKEITGRYALTNRGRFILDSLLLELADALDDTASNILH
ncbi:MAG: radical SAM family heme chaperone HemW [Spirochaetales bacterium]|nr:radical SAM family heme chaperone HemW [Spirochaetales bacterium]